MLLTQEQFGRASSQHRPHILLTVAADEAEECAARLTRDESPLHLKVRLAQDNSIGPELTDSAAPDCAVAIQTIDLAWHQAALVERAANKRGEVRIGGR